MSVAGRVDAASDGLSPAARRVAEVVLADPQVIAFGTVVDVARKAGASTATVVRLARALGYGGYVDLQAAVQQELSRRLRPAAERIRQPAAVDVLARTLATESDNVRTTLTDVDPASFARAVGLLASRRSRVFVLSGDESAGLGALFATNLSTLRDRVDLLGGPDVRVARQLAHLEAGDVVAAVDVRRYDRWLLDAVGLAVDWGAWLVAVTDSALSPLAQRATVTFVVSAGGAGPFDSHVGTLALLNALASGVAGRLRASATERLDRVETAWRLSGALVDP
jgi:DNA-binding MurR/RpiR family transcriptional regulator